jgi:hypothetical protein
MAKWVVCPKCHEKVQPRPSADGGKLRCPSCRVAIVLKKPAPVSADDDKLGIRKRPTPPAAARLKIRGNLEDDEGDPGRRCEQRDPDEEEAPRRRKSQAHQSSASGSIIFLCVFGVLALASLGTAAWIWQESLFPPLGATPNDVEVADQGKEEKENGPEKKPPVAAADLLSLAPPESCLVVGANLVEYRQKPEWQTAVAGIKAGIAGNNNIPLNMLDFIGETERIMAAVGVRPGAIRKDDQSMIVAVSFARPCANEFRALLAHVDMKPLANHESIYHRPLSPDDAAYLAVVDERLVVLGVMPQDDFLKAVANWGKTSRLSADLDAAARQAHQAMFRMAAANENMVKEQMQRLEGRTLGLDDDAMAALKRFTIARLILDILPSQELTIEATLDCANTTDAVRLQKLAGRSWGIIVNSIRQSIGAHPQRQVIDRVIDDVSRTFKVTQANTKVKAEARISAQVQNDLQRQTLQQLGGLLSQAGFKQPKKPQIDKPPIGTPPIMTKPPPVKPLAIKPEPIMTKPPDGFDGLFYLSDMQDFDNGFQLVGKFGKNGMLGYVGDNAQIAVAGKAYAKGLSTKPPANGAGLVRYRLPADARIFHVLVGVNDAAPGDKDTRPPETLLKFTVRGDGKVLWTSSMQTLGTTDTCRVSVDNVKKLELQVHCQGGSERARAVWLDPYVLTSKAELPNELKPAPFEPNPGEK